MCCCNDVINHADCVIKRDVYPQKMHSCSKNIRGRLYQTEKSWMDIRVADR